MESTSKPAVAHTANSASWSGWALALGATFASSIVTPIVRGAVVGGMDPITLLLLRLTLSVVLLGGTVAIMSPRLLRLERRGWLPVALLFAAWPAALVILLAQPSLHLDPGAYGTSTVPRADRTRQSGFAGLSARSRS